MKYKYFFLSLTQTPGVWGNFRHTFFSSFFAPFLLPFYIFLCCTLFVYSLFTCSFFIFYLFTFYYYFVTYFLFFTTLLLLFYSFFTTFLLIFTTFSLLFKWLFPRKNKMAAKKSVHSFKLILAMKCSIPRSFCLISVYFFASTKMYTFIQTYIHLCKHI